MRVDYAARDSNPTLPRSRARRRIHFSIMRVFRQKCLLRLTATTDFPFLIRRPSWYTAYLTGPSAVGWFSRREHGPHVPHVTNGPDTGYREPLTQGAPRW